MKGNFLLIALICLLTAEAFSQAQELEAAKSAEQWQEQMNGQAEKIAELLKANKLEKCVEECGDLETELVKKQGYAQSREYTQKYNDLCARQLVGKVRKLPKNKINTASLAAIYYGKAEQIGGDIIRKEGGAVIASMWDHNKMMDIIIRAQISGSIGEECGHFIKADWLAGYGKRIGNATVNVNGRQQSVPSYQLLWCDNSGGIDAIPISESQVDMRDGIDKKLADEVLKRLKRQGYDLK